MCVCVLLFFPLSQLYVWPTRTIVRTAFAVLASSLDRLWWHKLEGIYKWSFVCQENILPVVVIRQDVTCGTVIPTEGSKCHLFVFAPPPPTPPACGK